MLDEVFDAEAARARDEVASAQAKVDGVSEEASCRAALVEKVETDLQGKKDEVKVKQGALVEAVTAFRSAETTLSVILVDKDHLEQKQQEISEKIRVYLEAKEGDVKVLSEGLWEDESDFKQRLDRLSVLMKKLVDPSLLKALHSALHK